MNARRRVPTWPVWLLALPAAVSIWAGWVGLGGLTGFGEVQLLPGIWDGLRINTAITLPIGMEAYAAYALRAWLAPGAPARAREFARTSALIALGLGCLGQITYHLMAAARWDAAPWPVTAVVACLPVAVLGMGATLAHLLTEDDEALAPSARPQPTAPSAVRPAGTVSAPYRTVTAPAAPVAPSPVQASAPVAATPAVTEPSRAPLWTAPAAQSTDRTPVREADRPADRPTDRSVTRVADRPADRPVDRSGSKATDRPANRPARTGRSGSGRRSGSRKPRSDERVLEQIRDLTERNGRVPSQYQVKQALGVGSGRAARLLAEFATTTSPAAAPASNGAAATTGKEGSE